MKQPDTAALRERLANYTPEDELEQDKQELDGLLQEVNYQLIEFRNLMKEINALKEELHDIHGSLKHTVQRERTAFNALVAAKDSADNIVNGINCAIVKAEQHTVIRATVCTKAEKELLEEHSKKLTKHLRNNEGIWLSSRWIVFMIITQAICFLVIVLWSYLK